MSTARDEGLTLRQLYLRYAAGFGHWRVVGSAEQLADMMEDAFTTGAADGFAISSPVLPVSLRNFAELVVPESQRRGLFRTNYSGRTLRENLGLARPVRRDF